MSRYVVILSCEDEQVHLERGTELEEDQLSPEQIQLFMRLGAIAPLEGGLTDQI